MSIQLYAAIPPFEALATSNSVLSEKNLFGHYTLLYFYPRDNTPGCTTEGQDFTTHYQTFKELNCQIFGVSKDSLKKHENFKAKFNFPFELISDPEETLCQLFDVIKLKKNYGKEYLGIERSSFLIDPQGKLCHEWRKVKVANHVTEILDRLKAQQTKD